MPRRPARKTLDSLHVTLQKLEQTEGTAQHPDSISELKRVLLNRIADLELSKTLETADDETDKAPEPSDLVPSPSMTEEGPAGEAVDGTQLDELD